MAREPGEGLLCLVTGRPGRARRLDMTCQQKADMTALVGLQLTMLLPKRYRSSLPNACLEPV
jgi:hypothetical protein